MKTRSWLAGNLILALLLSLGASTALAQPSPGIRGPAPSGAKKSGPLVRETTTPLPGSSQYQNDLAVIRESQEHALELAQALEERALDPQAKALVESVLKEIENALKKLTDATNSPASLAAAVAAEQAAYQALLRLSAREYQVSRSRNAKGSGQNSGQQRNQRQVDELDLKQSENKYETQRQASPQQSTEQKEQLQILSRLKELAQRQQDLNDRLKELQTSLQEAKTEQEKEEIRRRLKRLREEEQEMLADVDELRQRMDQPENQSRMADARQQLDQTRSKVQQATEALDKESVPEALASGTRAQRDLQQLRDDFRKKNSNQFSDQMRQMRSEARDLAQKEEEIGKKLDSLLDNKRKTLSDSDASKALADQLRQQKSGVTNLLEDMRRVSEETETAEPLLSKQLYDTLRKANQDEAKSVKEITDDLLRSGTLSRSLYDKLKAPDEDKGGKVLDATSELLDQKSLPQASQTEQRARQGIDELKRGVERAAESILGDDTEALRLAKREIDDLTRQLDEEIAQADSAAATQGKTNQNARAAGGKSGQQQPGQNGSQQSASAENQQANQPGDGAEQTSAAQQQDSQGQPGQGQGQRPEGQSDGQQDSSKQASKGQKGSGKGQTPGENPGQQASQGQPGTEPGQGSGQNGKGQANTPGQPNQGQPGNQPGSPGDAQQAGQNEPTQAAAGERRGSGQRGRSGRQGGLQNLLNQEGGNTGGAEGGGVNRRSGPLMSDEFNTWSDRLRNVEEMVDLADVRNDVARVRERARALRLESKQKGQKPDWAVVRLQLAHPLAEVRNRLSEELSRRQSPDALVPIDRDPVPQKFSDLVRKYYEKLGGESAPDAK